jgi:glutamate synthase domain-containing protein 1
VCGIIGLFLKNPALEPELGRLSAAMLAVMSDRGPDSAGFAVYGTGEAGVKLTLRVPEGVPEEVDLASLGGRLLRRGDHAVLSLDVSEEAAVRARLARDFPGVAIVSAGSRMELYKGVGLPGRVSARYGLPEMAGTHAIGHTRMATESAVTIEGAHPFSTGPDQCLVHNGSLSNHNSVRRNLRREGLEFETENDSEVAAGYLTWRMRQGASLGEALGAAVGDLDGFYTFVVGTATGFGVLRDPIACKPAVMAETEDYVAFGSEYRALVPLPGIEAARLFEPAPGQVYFWDRPREAGL